MKTHFTSLDRHVSCECDYHEPDRWRNLLAIGAEPGLVARGSGLSYVAASFSEGGTSIGMRQFNRILALNEQARWIEVEAGVTLGKLYHVLIPRGLQLPVQASYHTITVGGCIAGNVHGKNHGREGVFGRHVLGLELFHPRHGVITASPTENAELFDLTIGGFGLTGIILRARLALAPLDGAEVEEQTIPVGSLEEAFREVGRLQNEVDMLYAWLDLANPHRPTGAGFITIARTVSGPPVKVEAFGERLEPNRPDWRRQRVFRAATLPWINRLYRQMGLRHAGPRRVPLSALLFPAVGKEFYFHLFGEPGFLEQQVLIPSPAVDGYIPEFRRRLTRHGVPVALTTLKAFKGGRRHLLHYDGDGFSFTIDVCDGRNARALLADLDDLNTSVGAMTCVIKDSRLSAEVVRRQYIGWGELRDGLAAFDPERLFGSALSKRLEL